MFDLAAFGAVVLLGVAAALAQWRAAAKVGPSGRAALTGTSVLGLGLLFAVRSLPPTPARIVAASYAVVSLAVMGLTLARALHRTTHSPAMRT